MAVIRAMKCTLLETPSHKSGGFLAHFENDEQKWKIEPDTSRKPITVRLHKDGKWYSGSMKFRNELEPIKFYDYNF
ncbi:MAG: hypothetical protein PHH23_01605 [Paludibacteraceae bacterium]|nr:hypothetical protein [Paludibacteraceae bacterium]